MTEVDIVHSPSTKFASQISDSSSMQSKESALRNLKTLCKQKLKSRVFQGHYQEKRYVSLLNTYKDLIVLNTEEKVFRDELATVFRCIQNETANSRDKAADAAWLGFTGPDVIGAPAGFCIWTTLDESEPLPFGRYWFQVKSVRFKEDVIEIQLIALRSAETPETQTTFGSFTADDLQQIDWRELFMSWKHAINQNMYRFMHDQITAANMVAAVKCIALIVVLAASSLVHGVKYLGEFTLKFMHETSKLVRAMTPFLMGTLNMCNKIIGGFYILVAMMWRDVFGGGGGPAQRKPFPAIQDRPNRYRTGMHSRFDSRNQPPVYQ